MIYRMTLTYEGSETPVIRDFKRVADAKEWIEDEIKDLQNPFRLASIKTARIDYIKTCESDKKRRKRHILYCI